MSALEHVSFVHLRLHSEYSIVDGMVRLDEAVAAAAADRMPALALTDLGNVFGTDSQTSHTCIDFHMYLDRLIQCLRCSR